MLPARAPVLDVALGTVAAVGAAAAVPDLSGDLGAWEAGAAALGVLLLAWVLVRRLRRGVVPPENPEKELTLQEHLEELQQRLVTVIVAWSLLALVFFSFRLEWATVAGTTVPVLVPSVHGSMSAAALSHLRDQFVPATVSLVVLRPVDAILAQVTMAVFMAVVVSAPLAAYEVAAFMAPGLTEEERSFILQVAPAVLVLFLAGVAFAYFVMVPITMEVLYGYATAVDAREFLEIDEMVNFVLLLHLLFGVAFELPVLMAAATEAGLASSDDFLRYWRHAVVVIVILGAMLSDPSPVTQLIVSGPLVVLYGLGIVASRWREGKGGTPEPEAA